jgi:hypothetical protein
VRDDAGGCRVIEERSVAVLTDDYCRKDQHPWKILRNFTGEPADSAGVRRQQ